MIKECEDKKKVQEHMAEKNVSRSRNRGKRQEGDMCRRLRRNLSRVLRTVPFYPRRSRGSPDARYLGCRGILQDHAQVGTPSVKLRNIPGRANRSMR